MFKIGKEFHLLHVVNDLDTVDGWYDDVFAERAAEHLLAKGQHFTEEGDSLELDRTQAFGMMIGFSETDIPNRLN